MKTVIKPRESCEELAAERIIELINKKEDAVIALCGTESEKNLYKRLICVYNSSRVSFKKVSLFLVADYVGLKEGDERSHKSRLLSDLISRTDFKAENCHFIAEDNFGSYDELIASKGGLDLCLLDIGTNARIGFNEPATQYETVSHIQKLTDKTRHEMAESFGGEELVPELGATMGIKTICRARDIIVFAFGESRKGPLFQMLYARTDSVFPAAFLQLPLNVLVLADEAAAELL